MRLRLGEREYKVLEALEYWGLLGGGQLELLAFGRSVAGDRLTGNGLSATPIGASESWNRRASLSPIQSIE